LADFLNEYGHRAVGEFELAQPRWREDASFVQKMINIFRNSEATNPIELFNTQKAERQRTEGELDNLPAGRLATAMRQNIAQELKYTQRYMPFRETAKFYIMLGYELIRKSLLELDRRFKLNGDIFYLTPEELPLLIEGQRLNDIISQRKHQREQWLKIDLPEVIFSDALEEIGKPKSYSWDSLEDSQALQGLSVSAGVAEGIASVVLDPTEVTSENVPSAVLVCPSTDPAWTPLFLNACALVMERGGMLSHGAVVAREYGIPAVVNIKNATKLIKEGEKVEVDGNKGIVTFLET
jgi:pyruvate,water dikinase